MRHHQHSNPRKLRVPTSAPPQVKLGFRGATSRASPAASGCQKLARLVGRGGRWTRVAHGTCTCSPPCHTQTDRSRFCSVCLLPQTNERKEVRLAPKRGVSCLYGSDTLSLVATGHVLPAARRVARRQHLPERVLFQREAAGERGDQNHTRRAPAIFNCDRTGKDAVRQGACLC